MNKGFNLQVVEFKEILAKTINESKLPPTVVQMVLNEFTSGYAVIVSNQLTAERLLLEKEGEDNGIQES